MIDDIIIKNFLDKNEYSRPGLLLNEVKGIVWHWVANTNTSASQNRNFFYNRMFGKQGYGSAHYIIGIKGEIIQCIPNNEMAYHVGAKKYTKKAIKELGNYPNNSTIGIELCHIDDNGNMTKDTVVSLILLTKYLCDIYNLNINNIYRHYDITKKLCPKIFVNDNNYYKYIKYLCFNIDYSKELLNLIATYQNVVD